MIRPVVVCSGGGGGITEPAHGVDPESVSGADIGQSGSVTVESAQVQVEEILASIPVCRELFHEKLVVSSCKGELGCGRGNLDITFRAKFPQLFQPAIGGEMTELGKGVCEKMTGESDFQGVEFHGHE